MDLQILQSLLGWCLIINFGLYMIWVVMMFAAGDWIVRLHAKWFKVEPEKLRPILYQFLGWYKLMIVMFNFTPWLAVVIINHT